MSDSVGRNDPCPCGSGRKYKRCCYRRDRSEPAAPSAIAGASAEDVRREIDQAASLLRHIGADADTVAIEEGFDGYSIVDAVYDAIDHWRVERHAALDGVLGCYGLLHGDRLGLEVEAFDGPLIEALDERQRALVERLRGATGFGAWRCEATYDGVRPMPVVRLGDGVETKVGGVECFGDTPAKGDVLVGWLVDAEMLVPGTSVSLKGGERLRFLLNALPLSADMAATLAEADGRAAWGRGGAFRRADYEADVLLQLAAVETVGLWEVTPVIGDASASLDGPVLVASQQMYWLEQEVLDLYHELLADLVVFRDVEDRWRGKFADWTDSQARPQAQWTFAVAEAADAQDRLGVLDVLLSLRDMLGEDDGGWWWTWRPPLSRGLAHRLLPDEALLEHLGLAADGEVRARDGRRAGALPVRVLEMDHEAMRDAGLDPSWRIDQAQRWAAKNASADLVDELEAAVATLDVQLRWATLVDHLAGSDVVLGYTTVRQGITRYFGQSLGRRRLDSLVFGGRGTAARLQKALAADSGDEPAYAVCDLPSTLADLLALDGVGDVTADHLTEALIALVTAWPGGAPVGADAAAQAEADRELADGLDALGSLFGDGQDGRQG